MEHLLLQIVKEMFFSKRDHTKTITIKITYPKNDQTGAALIQANVDIRNIDEYR